jgi:lysophospholipase L1-like esterase
VSREALGATFREIVRLLGADHGAEPSRILLAKPCYDYFETAAEALRGYCSVVDQVVAELGLSPGPDFFDAYSRDQARWYGGDPVHPNIEGMTCMARLWYEALRAAADKGP